MKLYYQEPASIDPPLRVCYNKYIPTRKVKEVKVKVVDLGFCPRCKEDISLMMTREIWEVKWCYLCSFDLEEAPRDEREACIRFAKEYKKNEC